MKALALALALVCAGAASAAAAPCKPRQFALELLARKYDETVIAAGVVQDGRLIEVTASEGGATWTILISTPRGLSCLLAAGEGWRSLKRQAPEEGT